MAKFKMCTNCSGELSLECKSDGHGNLLCRRCYIDLKISGNNAAILQRQCSRCGSTLTSCWRIDENRNFLCNSCGIYYKRHKEHRPDIYFQNVWKSKQQLKIDYERELQSRVCVQCGARETPRWRKDDKNQLMCNPCGLKRIRAYGLRREDVHIDTICNAKDRVKTSNVMSDRTAVRSERQSNIIEPAKNDSLPHFIDTFGEISKRLTQKFVDNLYI